MPDQIKAEVTFAQSKLKIEGKLDDCLSHIFSFIASAERRQAIINKLQADHNEIVARRWNEVQKLGK